MIADLDGPAPAAGRASVPGRTMGVVCKAVTIGHRQLIAEPAGTRRGWQPEVTTLARPAVTVLARGILLLVIDWGRAGT